MKRTILLAGATVLVMALTACGQVTDTGPQTSREHSVDGVRAVDLQTSGDLTIQLSEAESLTVTAGSNVIDNLTADVVDGTLVLGGRTGLSVTGPISYTLAVPGLERIELEASGNATGAGVLAEQGTVVISGSGSATLSDLEFTTVTADLSGSGDARLSGSADAATVTVSGSGDFDGTNLTVQRARVDVSGSGTARLNVSAELAASTSGSGDVIYTGRPPSVQRDRSGSGDIVAG